MNKKIVVLLMSIGIGLFANIANAEPPCPPGEIRFYSYIRVLGSDGIWYSQVVKSWCGRPFIPLDDLKSRSSIVDPNDPNNGMRILDPNDKERAQRK